ncbi:orotate phosphoribosyltransferase [Candidatus Woesebacteria bacterium]|nr:orotate phosphoribosyltransferase [Candidatus Woesebacteria bacterium]
MNDIAREVAKALIEIGGVGFVSDNPITFKSGILSPMYMDNRKFPSYPKQWRVVLDGFIQVIKDEKIEFELFVGIETAGIPHSAALGALTMKPSVFVRKEAKDHGTKKMVEGGEVTGKTVLLIEDLVTTGGSSLHGVTELRNAGAEVNDCLVIAGYDLDEAKEAFQKAKIKLHQLTSVKVILEVAEEMGKITLKDKQIVSEWLKNPREWRG